MRRDQLEVGRFYRTLGSDGPVQILDLTPGVTVTHVEGGQQVSLAETQGRSRNVAVLARRQQRDGSWRLVAVEPRKLDVWRQDEDSSRYVNDAAKFHRERALKDHRVEVVEALREAFAEAGLGATDFGTRIQVSLPYGSAREPEGVYEPDIRVSFTLAQLEQLLQREIPVPNYSPVTYEVYGDRVEPPFVSDEWGKYLHAEDDTLFTDALLPEEYERMGVPT